MTKSGDVTSLSIVLLQKQDFVFCNCTIAGFILLLVLLQKQDLLIFIRLHKYNLGPLFCGKKCVVPLSLSRVVHQVISGFRPSRNENENYIFHVFYWNLRETRCHGHASLKLCYIWGKLNFFSIRFFSLTLNLIKMGDLAPEFDRHRIY